MPTKQKRAYCKTCDKKTLHVATWNETKVGIGGHVFLSIITLGLWLPVAIICISLGSINNSLAPVTAKYHCQECGTPL